MQASHEVSGVFDDPNLIGSAGLVPVMRLPEKAGLQDLLMEHLNVPSANAAVKATGVVGGCWPAGTRRPRRPATRRDGQGLYRRRGPLTLGHVPALVTFAHVRQFDAVAFRVLTGPAAAVPRMLSGTDAMAFVDIDDTIREVHGYAKQGAAGRSRRRG